MKIKKAFTLIELLVVISIIALLLSILVPSLGRAKEVAKRSICGTNLKSLGQGIYAYAAKNNDLVPKGFYEAGSDDVYKKLPFFGYYLFVIVDDPSLLGKQRVIGRFGDLGPVNGLGYLFMTDLVETGKSFYCPGTPKEDEGIKHRYEWNSKDDGSDFPWNSDPPSEWRSTSNGYTGNEVISSYIYIPQASRNLFIEDECGSGMFPATATKAFELNSNYALVTDNLGRKGRLPHKKGHGKRAGGVNLLFGDGSVQFRNNPEAFTDELWERSEALLGNQPYLFREVLSRLE